MALIHPTAIVDPKAELDGNVTVGAYSKIEKNVRLTNGVVLSDHVIVKSGSILDKDVKVHSFAVIGDIPQILNFNDAIPSGVTIGQGTTVREGVTIHRASRENALTSVGENVFLMAYSHIAHDCKVGHHAIFANNVLLAGDVTIEPYVFLGGGCMMHQFVTIGESAILGGNATISQHIPPFTIAAGRNGVIGINLVGLKRRKFSREEIADIKSCYRKVYLQNKNAAFKKNAQEAYEANSFQTEKGKQFLSFFFSQAHARGFAPHINTGALASEEA